MLMQRLLLLSAVALSGAAAFTAPQRLHARANSATALDVIKGNAEVDVASRRDVLAGLAAAAASLALPNAAFAAGAYQSEAGYDDFSGGLTLPKYNVDNEGQLGLSGGKEKEVDPQKAEKMQAKADAAKAKALAKAEAEAAKKAAKAEAEAAKLEAAAAKVAAKEEQKKRQLANMSEQQRAKIEAYEAKKAEEKAKGSAGYAIDNMKRMYGGR